MKRSKQKPILLFQIGLVMSGVIMCGVAYAVAPAGKPPIPRSQRPAVDRAAYSYSGTTWLKKQGRLTEISASSDGEAWGVNSAGQVWRWNGKAWEGVPGQLTRISVGSKSNVWGLRI